MQTTLGRAGALALAATLSVAIGATPALATDDTASSSTGADQTSPRGETVGANCQQDFRDSANELWDINGAEGYVGDGIDDSYDSYGFASLGDAASDDWDDYSTGGANCSFEEDGRELVMPTREMSFLDEAEDEVTLELQRKIYVPAQGLAFARWTDIVTNPGEESASFNYRWYGDYGSIGNEREGERTIDSHDGDEEIDVGEPWGAFRNDDEGEGQVASLWDGVGGDGWDFPYDGDGSIPGFDGSEDADFVYDTITLAPGESVVFMHVEHQNTVGEDGGGERGSPEDAAAFEEVAEFARANEAGSDELYAGMSDEELEALRNWTPDSDRDGVLQFRDNCTAVANPDQADTDGDGEGDACDDDIDGDGLTNAQEQRLGTDPANANSDGDALADGFDACPTRAGNEPDGCPVPAQVSGSTQRQVIGRLRARRLTANHKRTRGKAGLKIRTSGRLLLPAGMNRAEGCAGQVLVIVKAGRLTVSTRRVDLRPDCRYRSKVTFSERKRLGNRTLNVRATFQGNARLFRQRAKRDYIGQA